MNGVAILGHRGKGALVGACLWLAAPIAVSHGAYAAYKFKIVDIPVQITFQGEPRTDIVRLTDINAKGQLVGNDFAGNGFFVRKNHKVTTIHCPDDLTDNDSTTISAINNVGQVVGSCTDGVSPNQRIVGFVRDRTAV